MESVQGWLQHAIQLVMKKTTDIQQDPLLLTGTTLTSILVAYMCTVRYYRYQNLNTIRKKYPNPDVILHDAEAARFVYNTIVGKEFPYLTRLSIEMAFFKTFTVPTISKILVGGGEFDNEVRITRRAEDTDLLLREITEKDGRILNQLNEKADTPQEDIKAQGQRSVDAMQRLNELHGKYRILNGDFLYTLTLFVFEPTSWVNRFEWRELDEREVNAMYKVWYDIGKDMNIEGIPDTVEGLLKFKEEYGSSHIGYHPANWEVGEPTVRLLLSQYPTFLREAMYPMAIRLLPSLLHSQDAEAFHLPHKENKLLTLIVNGTLRARALFTRYFLLPRTAFANRTPFYPNEQGKYVPTYLPYSLGPYAEGYKINEFGPLKFLKKKNVDHPPIDDLSDIMPSCPMMH